MSTINQFYLSNKIIDSNEKLQKLNAEIAHYILNLQSNGQAHIHSQQHAIRRRLNNNNNSVRSGIARQQNTEQAKKNK